MIHGAENISFWPFMLTVMTAVAGLAVAAVGEFMNKPKLAAAGRGVYRLGLTMLVAIIGRTVFFGS